MQVRMFKNILMCLKKIRTFVIRIWSNLRPCIMHMLFLVFCCFRLHCVPTGLKCCCDGQEGVSSCVVDRKVYCHVLSVLRVCCADSSAGVSDTEYSRRLSQSNKKYNERWDHFCVEFLHTCRRVTCVLCRSFSECLLNCSVIGMCHKLQHMPECVCMIQIGTQSP